MKRRRSQSLIINNFFTLASIVMISITIILYSKYITTPLKPKEIKKEEVSTLFCQKQNYSMSFVYNQRLLNNSIKALNNGYYKLNGEYIKSEYSKSIIEKFISLDELNSFYISSIKVSPKKDINKFLDISYKIIENDKKSPYNKKKKTKLYSGSIQTIFKAKEKKIFSFYTDFRLYDKDEIQSQIDCTIKVYKNHVKKL